MRLLIRRLADAGHDRACSPATCSPRSRRSATGWRSSAQGRIVYEGEIAELKRGAGHALPARRRPTTSGRWPSAGPSPGSPTSASEHGRISFTADENAAAELSQALVEAGALIRAMAPQTVTLEDLFFSLTEGDGVPEPRRRTRIAAEPCAAGGERPLMPGVAHRVPLGAVQAPPPEAHLPRARAPRSSSRSCSCSPSTSATPDRGGDFAFSAYLDRSGLAVPLVILLFGAVWMFPLITALVAGDIVASEDHNGTLKTIFTRSLERWQIFAGKALAATTYAIVAILLCGTVAVVAGQHPVGLQLAAEPVGHDRLGAEGARAGLRRACSST